MSWSRSKQGLGSEVAFEVGGQFAQEYTNPWHSPEARQILESHERAIHVFGVLHHADEIRVSSYGHFNTDGSGSAHLTLDVVEIIAQPQGEEVNGNEFSPVVEVGITTPETPADKPDVEVLSVGAGLLPPVTEPTGSEGPES